MKRLQKSLGIVLVSALLGMTATACEENESVLFIVGVMDVERSDCVAAADSDAAILAEGTLDLSLRRGYRAALLVGSHLTQRGSRDQLRTETARFSLQGAEVTLTNMEGQLLPLGRTSNPYSTIGTGFVNPSSGDDPGYGVTFVDIVPPGLSNIADQTIISRVRAYGRTLGGAELESNEYVFPITVCTGCLVQFSTATVDPTQPGGRCRTVSAEDEPEFGGCFPGQDRMVPCTYCSNSNAACQDPCSNCSARAALPACAGTPVPPACETTP